MGAQGRREGRESPPQGSLCDRDRERERERQGERQRERERERDRRTDRERERENALTEGSPARTRPLRVLTGPGGALTGQGLLHENILGNHFRGLYRKIL